MSAVVDLNQGRSQSSHGNQLGAPQFSLYLGVDASFKRFDPLTQLEYFESKLPEIMEAFRQVGIHPTKSTAAFNPYTGSQSSQSFANIGEHCIATAYCASQIAKVMLRAGQIDQAQFNTIVQQALVHDLNKPYEIMRRDASKMPGADKDVYSVSAYERLLPIVRGTGVSEDVIDYLAVAGRETGHNSLAGFIAIEANGFHQYPVLVRGKLSDKIVHLADDMTYTSVPKSGERPITLFQTCWERMLSAQFAEKYPFLETEGLALTLEGKIVPVRDVTTLSAGSKLIGSYLELQVFVARKICDELKSMLDSLSQEDSQRYIKKIVNEA